MSGLVTGLQNRAQRFESASDLNKKAPQMRCFFVSYLKHLYQSRIVVITYYLIRLPLSNEGNLIIVLYICLNNGLYCENNVILDCQSTHIEDSISHAS